MYDAPEELFILPVQDLSCNKIELAPLFEQTILFRQFVPILAMMDYKPDVEANVEANTVCIVKLSKLRHQYVTSRCYSS